MGVAPGIARGVGMIRGEFRHLRDSGTPVFLGIDLGWYGKPSGLASIGIVEGRLRLLGLDRIAGQDQILAWVAREVGDGDAIAAVDAPLVIANETGIRRAESELNRDFRRYDAGCHAANLGRPFATKVLAFSEGLAGMRFGLGAAMEARAEGRFQIEVHPHAASVNLFDLPRIVKYKRGLRAARAKELGRLRGLMMERLAGLTPGFEVKLPGIPRVGNLKPVEDRIDAVMCAYIAAYWWYWGRGRNRVYGDNESGFVVVPDRVVSFPS